MLSGQDNLEIAVDSIKYGARDYVIKNESAFVRMKQIVNNIIENIYLKKDLKRYSIWNWTFGGVVILIAIAFGIIQYL